MYGRGPGISFWVAALAPVVVGLTRVKPSLFETGLTPPALMWTRCVRAADILAVLSRSPRGEAVGFAVDS